MSQLRAHPAVSALRAVEAEIGLIAVGRAEEIRGLLVALIARSHVFLMGSPGSGKSYIAAETARRVRGATVVREQLHAFITRDDLFGPVRLSALKERDALERNSAGRLPAADLAIIDEVWKCPPATLQTLLTLLNERLYRNADLTMRAPLVSAYLTSNELPAADGAIDALYDRIALRYAVRPIADRAERRAAAAAGFALRAFEEAARRAAGEIAAGREARTAARLGELRTLFAKRLETRREDAARAAAAAGLTPEAIAAELIRIDRETDAAIAEASRATEAEAAAGAIDRPGAPAHLATPERWLIDRYGELFADPARRAAFVAGSDPLPAPIFPEQQALLERMIDWANERPAGWVLPYAAFISREEIDALHRMAIEISIPGPVDDAFAAIIEALPSAGGPAISMRRENELRLLIAAHAVIEGRSTAAIDDLAILRHALWERPEQIETVRRVVEEETGNRVALIAAIRETIRLWESEPLPSLPSEQIAWARQREHEIAEFRAAASIHPEDDEIAAAIEQAARAIAAARERLTDPVPVSAESTTPTAAPTDDPSAKPKKAKAAKATDQSTLFGDEE
jgi:MoxR-like ATPase